MRRAARRIRVGIAAVTILMMAVVCIAPDAILSRLSRPLVMFQAVPSALRLVGTLTLVGALPLALLLVLTLLTGRTYCACLCPLGILQDLARRVGRLLSRRRRRRQVSLPLDRSRRRIVRGGVLAALVLGILAGTLSLLIALDPYSIWSRLMSGVAVPAVGWARTWLAMGLEKMDIYALSGGKPRPFSVPIVLAAALPVVGILVLAFFWGRLYCITLCPVGTCLGYLSRYALFRIRLDGASCNTCGQCVRTCRADCIEVRDDGTAVIHHEECVVCGDCLAICPTGALSLGARAPAVTEQPSTETPLAPLRRRLLVAGTACVAVGVPARLLLGTDSEEPATPGPVCPPGSGSRAHFSATCTACHRCVTACPTGVLRPALLEYGLAGMLQPHLSFEHGYCEYDCTRCSEACPTGAIRSGLDLHEKHRIQLGTVALHRRLCVVYLNREDCGACAEVCPTHAVYTRNIAGVLYPAIAPEACVGCGACENACPQLPKAIVVKPHAVHKRATAPYQPVYPTVPIGPPKASQGEEGFPF